MQKDARANSRENLVAFELKSPEEGFVKVVSPIDGTPADEAMEAGDFITHVDGESVLGLTLNEAVERMRDPLVLKYQL